MWVCYFTNSCTSIYLSKINIKTKRREIIMITNFDLLSMKVSYLVLYTTESKPFKHGRLKRQLL